jgi:dCMP deaminase
MGGNQYQRIKKMFSLPPWFRRFSEKPEVDNPQEKWDRRFLEMAKLVASWSKDPSTKCGAVIVRPDKTVCSVGYNGFPRGMEDKPEWYANRQQKYPRIVHSDMNALLSSRDQSMEGYTLYGYPFIPCDRCFVHIMQAGIKRIVCPEPSRDLRMRWGESLWNVRRFCSDDIEIVEYKEQDL